MAGPEFLITCYSYSSRPALPPLAPVFATIIARLTSKPYRQLSFNLA